MPLPLEVITWRSLSLKRITKRSLLIKCTGGLNILDAKDLITGAVATKIKFIKLGQQQDYLLLIFQQHKID